MSNFKEVFDAARMLKTEIRPVGSESWLKAEEITSISTQELDQEWEIKFREPQDIFVIFNEAGHVWGVNLDNTAEYPSGYRSFKYTLQGQA